MNIRTLVTRLSAAITLGISTPALSDISLTYQSVATPEHRSTILVSQDVIRFENPMTPEFFMLFNAERQHMTLVDSEKKSYSVLDRETLESLSEQIDVTRQAIIAELKAGMALAEAEEKAQMAEILEQMELLAGAPEKEIVRYQPRDERNEINGYNCSMVDALVDDEPHANLCVVSAQEAGVPAEVMNTLESFHHFSSSVHQQLSPGDTTELLFVMNSKDQLPVSIRRIQPESVADEYRLTNIEELSIPASAFQVPDNYEARDIEDAFIVE